MSRGQPVRSPRRPQTKSWSGAPAIGRAAVRGAHAGGAARGRGRLHRHSLHPGPSPSMPSSRPCGRQRLPSRPSPRRPSSRPCGRQSLPQGHAEGKWREDERVHDQSFRQHGVAFVPTQDVYWLLSKEKNDQQRATTSNTMAISRQDCNSRLK